MTPQNNEVVRLLVKYGRAKVLKHFRADSCIASTRVALDVLGHFGITAKAQPVRLHAFNARLWGRISGGTFNPDAVDAERFLPGEWSVGVGFPGAPVPMGGAFMGHLVATVPDGAHEWLIDLSLDQAHRPKHGIHLGPAVFKLPAAWRDAGERFCIRCHGVALIYTEIKNDSYFASPDWNDRDGEIKRIVTFLISRIGKKLPTWN